MKNIIKKIKENKKLIEFLTIAFIMIALSIYACYPYINENTIFAHDLSFHLNRILNIVQGFKDNQIPVLIHTELLDGIGYGNPLFYPEIFLYIPALIVLKLNIGVIASYKIFIWILTLGTFIIMYLTTKKITKSKTISLMACILYTMSLYRFTDIYIRGAIGEILAFMFMPLILYGMYDILYCDGKKWWVLVLGTFCIANSHIISLVMSLEIIIFFGLINIKKIFTNKKILIKLLITGILCVIICSSVIFPLIEQLKSGNYKISEPKENPGKILNELALTVTEALKSELIFGWAATDSPNMDDLMTLGIGVILYILPSLLLFSKSNKDENKKFILLLLILGIFTAILTTRLFPWKYLGFLSSIQYPWRFNLVATLVLSIVSAYAVYTAFDNNKLKVCTIITIIILCMASLQLDNVDINIPNGSYTYLINWAPVANGEYLPQGFDKESEFNKKVINLDTNEEYEYERNGTCIKFNYSGNNAKSELINVPLIYYKGYVATIENEKELKTLPISVGKNGLTYIKIGENMSGNVTIKYKMTKIQKLGYILTGISIIACIIIGILKYRKNRNK